MFAISHRRWGIIASFLGSLGLLIATLFGVEAGIIISIPISLLVPYDMSSAFDLMPYYLISSLVGVLVLGLGMGCRGRGHFPLPLLPTMY